MDELTLLDWKRRIFALYAEVRAADDPESAWQRWCDVRSDLSNYLSIVASSRGVKPENHASA